MATEEHSISIAVIQRETISIATPDLFFVIIQGSRALFVFDIPKLHQSICGGSDELQPLIQEVDSKDRVGMSFKGLRKHSVN